LASGRDTFSWGLGLGRGILTLGRSGALIEKTLCILNFWESVLTMNGMEVEQCFVLCYVSWVYRYRVPCDLTVSCMTGYKGVDIALCLESGDTGTKTCQRGSRQAQIPQNPG
jgi:hypothetical protein